jgi:hypothetical protein
MTLLIGFIALFLLIVLLVIAIGIGVNKEKTEKEEPRPIIHASGIYSVVRTSPRNDIMRLKPSGKEMRKYLSGINEDSNGAALSAEDKERLSESYWTRVDKNISEIEKGDRRGAEFYFYDFEWDDPVCGKYLSKGRFVTREEIFKHGRIVPPFHLGCSCRIQAHKGSENLRETTELGLRPLFEDDSTVPPLPNWHTVLRIP